MDIFTIYGNSSRRNRFTINGSSINDQIYLELYIYARFTINLWIYLE